MSKTLLHDALRILWGLEVEKGDYISFAISCVRGRNRRDCRCVLINQRLNMEISCVSVWGFRRWSWRHQECRRCLPLPSDICCPWSLQDSHTLRSLRCSYLHWHSRSSHNHSRLLRVETEMSVLNVKVKVSVLKVSDLFITNFQQHFQSPLILQSCKCTLAYNR